MKARTIHTKFYQSERVLQLSAIGRWLYMYYLTNEGIGLTGAFKWSDSRTIFETGLTKTQLSSAKAELEAAKLVVFLAGWVIVPGTTEKTNFDKGKLTSIAYQREFSNLPEEIKELLTKDQYPINTLLEKSDRVSIPIEIRNKKLEIRKGESVRGVGSFDGLTDQVLESIALELGVPVPEVRKLKVLMGNYLEANGKRYKDYQAAMKNWVLRRIDEGKLSSSKPVSSKPKLAEMVARAKGL